MIYTRFGSVVQIVKVVNSEDFQGWVIVEYEDGDEREAHVSELKADKGWAEISDRLNELEPEVMEGE